MLKILKMSSFSNMNALTERESKYEFNLSVSHRVAIALAALHRECFSLNVIDRVEPNHNAVLSRLSRSRNGKGKVIALQLLEAIIIRRAVIVIAGRVIVRQ